MTTERWPTELRLAADRRSLRIVFDDGAAFDLPAEYLRVTSPSAEVQGHSPAERRTVPGKRNVEIVGVEPVGNYAVKLIFDDMHDTGIYGWDYLYRLGAEKEERFAAYLAELQAKGLSRDR
ncbi:gamma-butyrobetaine hydroxylase-like domain-containing protein [Microvirga thermotolerans]|uniref:DUF971 domain-containing protein n=1 Tax=Microvirga thermotolerans TaxID=2651334 RepID=A0A5P9JWR1_9HYPH|nr:DUF971 domain-containing protein [Microvirga thermotolerans]QFU17037.1 DUF971 domain-containing protein [Microvirga thermotolerans]